MNPCKKTFVKTSTIHLKWTSNIIGPLGILVEEMCKGSFYILSVFGQCFSFCAPVLLCGLGVLDGRVVGCETLYPVWNPIIQCTPYIVLAYIWWILTSFRLWYMAFSSCAFSNYLVIDLAPPMMNVLMQFSMHRLKSSAGIHVIISVRFGEIWW